MGIDKGNSNAVVINYDTVFGVHYPSVSGQEGGGNQVHLTYEIQGTPTIVIITPNHVIKVKQIYPPSTAKVVDSVMNAGGILMDCTTGFEEMILEDSFTLAPNPASDRINVNLNLISGKELEFRIFDNMGMLVRSLPPSNYPQGQYRVPVNLQGLKKGLYFIQVTDEKQVLVTKKLVVSH
jgi:hypothetical protein